MKRGRSQLRRGTRSPASIGASCAARTGGLSSHSPAPDSRMPAARVSMAARGLMPVAISTPRAGPDMKLISVVIESRAKAGRRCDSGVRAAIDCRATENAGNARKPPSRARRSSPQYGRACATLQKMTSETVVSSSTGRRPRRSTSRPIKGAPIEPPMVSAAPTRPAAP